MPSQYQIKSKYVRTSFPIVAHEPENESSEDLIDPLKTKLVPSFGIKVEREDIIYLLWDFQDSPFLFIKIFCKSVALNPKRNPSPIATS